MQFTLEQTQEHLAGLQASKALIEKLIADAVKTQEEIDTMDRNIRHLEIMMAMDHIKNSNVNLAPFVSAKDAGKTWINS